VSSSTDIEHDSAFFQFLPVIGAAKSHSCIDDRWE